MSAVPPAHRRSRILVADDDPLTRRLVREMLVAAGHEVYEAASGNAAVRQFRLHAPDLVLLDVRMPDGDGFDACAQLRELDPSEASPIIMLTALNDTASLERAFAMRATDFIVKPFNRTLLLRRVHAALHSRSLDSELRRSRERQAVSLRMARLTFWEWQPETGQMTWSSDSLPLKDGSGRPPSTPAALMARMQPPDAERFAAALARAQGSGEPFDLEFELDGDQHVVRMLGAQASASAGIPLVNGALQDVTSLRRSEALADYLARHDELTGLDNRRRFTEQLDAALARLREPSDLSGNRRPPERVVLVGLLDITMFQRLNDALGESVANRVLTHAGLRIRAFLTPPQLVGRVDGDAFAVTLEADDADDAIQRFDALVAHLREPLPGAVGHLALSWTAGYAVTDGRSATAPSLLTAAQTAQRAARNAGGTIAAASPHPERARRSAQRLDRESALRSALENGGFRVAVQPQLDVRTRRVIGVETLLRWTDPTGREVAPSEFVPILEETGMIVEAGAWCLEEACRWQRRWQHAGEDLRVAVNLSPRQFTDPHLLSRLSSIIEAAGVPTQRIVFELTESLAMQRPDQAAEVLSAFRDRGVLVAIDDFGVGFSSLASLVRFPLDTIKLDRSFTANLLHSRPVEAIVRAATVIADSMGLTTIAEGVETEEQAIALSALGITEWQGYYVARPMPPELLIGFIRGAMCGVAGDAGRHS
jgi:diguanylate cyclase (GGDEF)-like protein